MADVFISYSRRDGEFVHRLVDALQAHGKDVWVDVQGIRDAEVFPAALREAVERSDGFVFVISPDSVASRFCEQEVDHALELNKRIVPLVVARVPDDAVPEGVRVRNWIPFEEDAAFERGVDRLVQALDTDVAHAKAHTSWLLKALEWDGNGRDRSFLLRGSELSAAERWLSAGAGKDPEPTPLQHEYVYASRAASSRRQRALVGASLVVAAVSVALLIFALVSRHQVQTQRTTAKSRALAALSQNQLGVDPELSILLGREAVSTEATPEALFSLRDALDQSPLRRTLARQARQDCAALPGIAWRPGGGQIARGLCDGHVLLTDARTGRQARRVAVAKDASIVAYSPDGSLLAVGTDDGVRLLDPASGSVRRVLAGGGQVTAIAFSRDGRRLGATTDQAVRLWDVRTGRGRTLARRAQDFGGVAFTPDGRRLLAGSCGCSGGHEGLNVFDVRTGARLPAPAGFFVIDSLRFTPDGRTLAVADFDLHGSGAGRVSLWDARTFKRTATLVSYPALEVASIALSPDGHRLAVGAADGTAGLWSLDTRRQIVSFLGHTALIGGMAFSPDGREVATSSADGTARVWRGRGLEQLDIATGDSAASMGPPILGRDRVTAALGDTVRARSFPGGRPLRTLYTKAGPTERLVLSPDATRAAVSAPRGVEVWDVGSRRMIRRLPPRQFPTLWFSADGTRLFVSSGEKPAVVASVSTGRSTTLAGFSTGNDVRAAAFNRAGTLVAGGEFNGAVSVWRVSDGRLASALVNNGQIADMAFSRDGRRLYVASWDSSLTVWDWRARKVVRVVHGPGRGLTSLAVSPDGTLVAAGSLDGTVWEWDASDFRRVRILRHPEVAVVGTYSPDGRRLVTLSFDGTVRVWDACTACRDPKALMALASRQVTRRLTPLERATFLRGY